MPDTTDVRSTIANALAAALEIDFVGAKVEGPSREREFGCLWPEMYEVDGEDANFVNFGMVARVILPFEPPVDPADVQDPSDLEAVAQAITVTVATLSKTTLAGTFLTVHGAQYDMDAWSVDVFVTAQIPNPYDPG